MELFSVVYAFGWFGGLFEGEGGGVHGAGHVVGVEGQGGTAELGGVE